MNRIHRILLAVSSLTLTTVASAATPSSADSSYLKRATPRFESFAGSNDNLSSLAGGLRSGRTITLTGSGEKAVFTAPTKPMGYGNVTRSLDLAQRQLAMQGISNPTPSQLQTALMGGTITTSKSTVVYRGVLQMRSDGMGWGKIANSTGIHPGLGKAPTAAAASSAGIRSAGGPSLAANSSASRGNSTAAAHASGQGLGHSAAVTSAAGANAGGGHGNAFGRSK
jgi:hypothetical protein